MPNEIYHRSNWGESKAEGFGDVYYDHAATNKLYNHSDYYENSDGTDATLKDLNNKASIVLTPTAYSDGSLNTVIPPYQVLPTELVTNGTFDTDSDWTKGTGWTISGGKAIATSAPSGSQLYQTSLIVGKTYQATFTITDITSGAFRFLFGDGSNTSGDYTSAGTYTVSLTAANSNRLGIRTVGTTSGSVDNVSVKEIQEADFDFSRGSSATRVNEQGLVEDVQILSGELVQNGDFEQIGSELVINGDFATDSNWSKGGVWTIENGSANGDATFGNLGQTVSFVGGKFYKVTYEVKNHVNGNVKFQFTGGGTTVNGTTRFANGVYTEYVKAETGNVNFRFRGTNFTGSIDNASVKEVGQNWTFGTGWSMGDGKVVADGTMSASNNLIQSYNFTDGNKYRFSFTISDYQSGSIFIRQPFSGGADAVSANGTFTFDYIAGSANEIRFRSNDGFIGSLDNVSYKEVTDDTDLPRIDFTDGTGSLLLEPQRTNLISYSEDFSSLDIRNNAVVTSDAILSPSGLLNADEITFDGTSSGRVQEAITVTDNQSYTISLYLKNKNLSDTTQVWIGFSSSTQGSYVTITDEWQRYDITTTSDNTTEYPRIQFEGTGSLYAWGFQVEQGDYATSYIVSNSGSATTRSADVANNSGNADLFNDSEGVLYAEIAALADDGTNRQITISDGSSTNRIYLGLRTQSNQVIGGAVSSGVENFMNHTLSDTTVNFKLAFKYKQNDLLVFLNGTQVNFDNTANIPTGLNQLSFDNGGGTQNFYGDVKCVAVFKEALSNDLLERLTGEGYESFRLLAEANNYTII